MVRSLTCLTALMGLRLRLTVIFQSLKQRGRIISENSPYRVKPLISRRCAGPSFTFLK